MSQFASKITCQFCFCPCWQQNVYFDPYIEAITSQQSCFRPVYPLWSEGSSIKTYCTKANKTDLNFNNILKYKDFFSNEGKAMNYLLKLNSNLKLCINNM